MNNIIIITGGTSGLGLELVKESINISKRILI